MAKHFEVILYLESDDGKKRTKENILEVINGHSSIKTYALILHDLDKDENGQPIKPHYHLYIHFGTGNVPDKLVAKWFDIGENLVQRIKSNRATVLRYYLHEGYPGKHPYKREDMVCNFDLDAYLEKDRQESYLSGIIEQCANGIITRYNFCNYVSPAFYAKHEAKLKRAWDYADQRMLSMTNGRFESQTIWVHGEKSGSGKTTLCKKYCDRKQLPVFMAASGNDPFSHYAGEPAIILDDLRPYKPFGFDDLLRLLDPHYLSPVHSRYKDKILRCTHIFVTSLLSPQQFMQEYNLSQLEDPAQLYRRISEVWNVTADTVTFSHYDLSQRTFITTATTPNPVKKYLENIPAVEPVNGAAVMLELLEQVSPTTASGGKEMEGEINHDEK